MKAISNHAYSLARKNKWFDDYIWMTSKDKKPIGYWNNYEHCKKEAKKYSSISEFQQKCYTGARYSSKNGWMGDFFKPKYKPRGYWNDYKKCKELAETCKTISEFSKKSSAAYYWSRINNWLEGFEWFVDQTIYNDNKIDCVYAYEFTEYNSAYIGRTLIRRIKKRDKEHHTSMYVDKKGVIHYTSDAVASFANEKNCNIPIMKILETNLTLKEGKIKEDEYRKFYEINGWTILNKAKTGKNSSSVGSLGKGKWNPKNAKEIALTCKSRSEFKRINGSAYETARKNGWLNDYTWFVSPQKPKDYWNIFDNIEKEAKKYKSRWDFGKHNGSAYEAARRNGWINKLFPQKEKFNEEENSVTPLCGIKQQTSSATEENE